MKKLAYLIAFNLTFQSVALSRPTCSRTAVINYQEVLVDFNSSQKGLGLKYYLEKDEKAFDHFEKYRQGNQINWKNAVMGTVGTSLIILGAIVNEGESSNSKKTLILSGASLLLVNFLLAKTFEKENEEHLQNAIEEYNKRNLPRIEFDQLSKNRPKGIEALILKLKKDF